MVEFLMEEGLEGFKLVGGSLVVAPSKAQGEILVCLVVGEVVHSYITTFCHESTGSLPEGVIGAERV